MDVIQSAVDYHRFCPGEERAKLSEAVCRSRRRTNFPKCHGCQFNDDEKGVRTPTPVTERARAARSLERVFRPCNVCAAVPDPLSEDVAWRIGYAAAQYLHGRLRGYDRANANARSVVVARDARPHGLGLQQALIDGIRAAGSDVVDIGLADTPQLFFAVNHIGAGGGIQTTGGNMPAEYNGFVFCGAKAAHIASETGLVSIRDIAVRVPRHATGTVARLSTEDLTQPYTDFVRGFLRGRDRLAKPMTIGVDARNGSAGRWLPRLFDRIENLTIVPLNFEHDGGFQHDPNPLDIRNLKPLRDLVRKHKADFGVCFGGDASSCAFVDERGSTVRPDRLAALLARAFIGRHPGATVVVDHRFSRVFTEEVQRAGGTTVLARSDLASIKKAISERNAVFGADLEGRFFFRENFFCESAVIALVQVLNLLTETDRRLSDLLRPLGRYAASGELRLPCADPEQALRDIAAAHPEGETDNFDGVTVRQADWWLNARPAADRSSVLLMVEARNKKVLGEKLAQIQEGVKGSRGPGVQGIRGSGDQGIRGSGDQGIRGSGDQGIRGTRIPWSPGPPVP